ncbi:uncharacterized protein LOC116219576 [Clupea harengus]|uniref:Uncharacterized protein LOC116219576 n=1 Tax=Clupea harengus TaxID=7950 RepID=A0A6P8F422_CLUHA|nr:uncharacterized protein LOC116219576 [Clupea harengus]
MTVYSGEDQKCEKDGRISGRLNEEKPQVFMDISSTRVSDTIDPEFLVLTANTGGDDLRSDVDHRISVRTNTHFADDIKPTKSEEMALKGENLMLSCDYTVSAFTLQWYRQYPRSAPEFLVLTANTAGDDLRSDICKITKLFFLFHHFAGESVGNTITPSHSSVVIIEGEHVTFSCNYSGDVQSLQWYRQYPNSIPEFLYYILETSFSSEKVPRLIPSINKEGKRVFLELSSTEASDSAVYYCALRPTVTGTPTL